MTDGNIIKINDETAKVLTVEGYVFEITMQNTVYVAKQDTLVKEINLNKTSTTIEIGETETLIATISPTDAYNKNVTWTSENEDIATIDSSGLVTAISEGTVTITATTQDGSGKSVTCSVTVQRPKLEISTQKLYAYSGASGGDANVNYKTLTYTITQADVDNNYDFYLLIAAYAIRH